MQIRVLPASSLPSIIYSFVLPDLPPEIPIPLPWDAERQRIFAEDLDVPRSIYAFDKSSWISSIVQDVAFDMSTFVISVMFQDGSVEEWPLADERCIRVLHNLLEEVRIAAEEERERTRPVSPPPHPESPLGKIHRHKKRGSLFQLVVGLMSPGNTAAPRPCAPPTPEVPLSDVATEILLSRHPLRFRARSLLVDTYRRFVIGELRTRLPPSGYTAWAANSMLRDTTDHMSDLVRRNGGVVPPPPLYSAPSVTRRSATHLFYDEEDDVDEHSLAETLSTDTDGSSLHTPLSTPVGTEVRRHGPQSAHASLSSCGGVGAPGPEAEAYHALQKQALQLRQLLVHVEIAHRNEDFEVRQLAAVLEVRSRRRAWSNHALCGSALLADVGLATPRESSPLARCDVVTPEALDDWRGYHPLARRHPEFDTTTLSAVSEEDQLVFPGDDEPLVFPGEEALAPPPLVRPRIRVRTHSSRPMLPLAPPPATDNSAKAKLGLQRLFEDERPFGDAPAEFTLAMDANEIVGGMRGATLYDDVQWVSDGAVAIAAH